MSTAVKDEQKKRSHSPKPEAGRDRRSRLSRLAKKPAHAGLTSRNRLTIGQFRSALGWTRTQLALTMNASDRAIVNWEAGDPMSPVYAAKLREIQNIFAELGRIMSIDAIGSWLLTEMEEFDGQSPSDLIRKGETGRVWASLFYLRTGMPD